MAEHSHRKHPAHGVKLIPCQPTIVFVTVCARDRMSWVATDDVHSMLCTVWREATAWRVGEYLLMPDHVHFFATPVGETIPLERWMKYWKTQFGLQTSNPAHQWQSDHWDTRMRSAEHYAEKIAYMRQNPVRRALVEQTDTWPYRGSMHELHWYA